MMSRRATLILQRAWRRKQSLRLVRLYRDMREMMVCCVCMEARGRMIRCPSGHGICIDCDIASEAFSNERLCPVCREWRGNREDRLLPRLVTSLPLLCDSCGNHFPAFHIESHREWCPSLLHTCPIGGCGKQVLSGDMVDHLSHHKEVIRAEKRGESYISRLLITRHSREVILLLGEEHCVAMKIASRFVRALLLGERGDHTPNPFCISLSCHYAFHTSPYVSARVRQYPPSGYGSMWEDECRVRRLSRMGRWSQSSHNPSVTPRSVIREESQDEGPCIIYDVEDLKRFAVKGAKHGEEEGRCYAAVIEVVFELGE